MYKFRPSAPASSPSPNSHFLPPIIQEICVRNVEQVALPEPPGWPEGSEERFFAFDSPACTLRAYGAVHGFQASSQGELERFQSRIQTDGRRDLPVWVGGRSFDGAAGDGEWAGWPGCAFWVPALLWVRVPEGQFLIRARAHGEAAPRLDLPASGRAPTNSARQSAPFEALETETEWHRWVAEALGCIGSGALQKVVLARRIRLCTGESTARSAWERLGVAPGIVRYAVVWPGCGALVGATPETLVRLSGTRLSTEALAGTAPAEEARALIDRTKDRGEHAFVVDALAEHIRPFARRFLIEGPHVQPYGHLCHLRTALEAELHAPSGLLEWMDRLHPTPAVAGVPRAASMALIQALEAHHRGWYAGALGWTDGAHAGHAVVALRCAMVREESAFVYAGAGIVRGSVPEHEWSETELKMRRMAEAL